MARTLDSLVTFFHEVGALKNEPRTGWFNVGIAHPEHVSDHMYRTMLLGYALAEMEGVDSNKVALMLLFHDLHESRLGDAHTVRRHYLNQDKAEFEVVKDQCALLPAKMAGEYLKLFTEFEERKTREAIIAKDADYLECALQAIEYRGQAGEAVEDWIESTKPVLKTESAKKILSNALNGNKTAYWRGFEERKK